MNQKYSEQFDTYYDEQTNEWLEDICDDPECDLCIGRTPTPLREIFVFGSNLAGRHGAGATGLQGRSNLCAYCYWMWPCWLYSFSDSTYVFQRLRTFQRPPSERIPRGPRK